MDRKSKKDVQKEIEEGIIEGTVDRINDIRVKQLLTVNWEMICKEAMRKAHVPNMSGWELCILNDGTICGPVYENTNLSFIDTKRFIVFRMPMWHVLDCIAWFSFSLTDTNGNKKQGYIWYSDMDKWVEEKEAVEICVQDYGMHAYIIELNIHHGKYNIS